MSLTPRLPIFLLATLMLLAGCQVPSLEHSREQEALLRERLYRIRVAIDRYTLDRKEGPAQLKDLIMAGYLPDLPEDPITGTREWAVEFEAVPNVQGAISGTRGITDVHSYSPKKGSDGRLYREW